MPRSSPPAMVSSSVSVVLQLLGLAAAGASPSAAAPRAAPSGSPGSPPGPGGRRLLLELLFCCPSVTASSAAGAGRARERRRLLAERHRLGAQLRSPAPRRSPRRSSSRLRLASATAMSSRSEAGLARLELARAAARAGPVLGRSVCSAAADSIRDARAAHRAVRGAASSGAARRLLTSDGFASATRARSSCSPERRAAVGQLVALSLERGPSGLRGRPPRPRARLLGLQRGLLCLELVRLVLQELAACGLALALLLLELRLQALAPSRTASRTARSAWRALPRSTRDQQRAVVARRRTRRPSGRRPCARSCPSGVAPMSSWPSSSEKNGIDQRQQDRQRDRDRSATDGG